MGLRQSCQASLGGHNTHEGERRVASPVEAAWEELNFPPPSLLQPRMHGKQVGEGEGQTQQPGPGEAGCAVATLRTMPAHPGMLMQQQQAPTPRGAEQSSAGAQAATGAPVRVDTSPSPR